MSGRVAAIFLLRVVLVWTVLSCEPAVEDSKGFDPNTESIRLATMLKLVDANDASKGYAALASALIYDQRLHVEGYFAAFIATSARLDYFDALGDGLVSQIVTPTLSYSYTARWDILDQQQKSVLSLQDAEGKFVAVRANGTARNDASKSDGPSKGAVAYFRVGKNLQSGDYTLIVNIYESEQDAALPLASLQRTLTVVPPFSFSEKLRLSARGGAFSSHTNIEGHPLMEQLEEVALQIDAKNPRWATATLLLRQQAQSSKIMVFHSDFSLSGDASYRVKEFVKQNSQDDTSDNSMVTYVTRAKDTGSYALAGNSKDPVDSAFPLTIEGYATFFTAQLDASQKASSKRGRIVLVVYDPFGQRGEITVYLSPRDYSP